MTNFSLICTRKWELTRFPKMKMELAILQPEIIKIQYISFSSYIKCTCDIGRYGYMMGFQMRAALQ